MKKTDIVHGEEYAYSTYEWGTRQRVKVVGEGRITQGYGYNQRKVSGIRVQVLDTLTGKPAVRKIGDGEPQEWFIVTTGRNIRELWAPYWANQQANLKARQDSARHLAEMRDQRSRLLLDLIPALRHVGFEDSRVEVRDTKILTALQAHVEDCLTEGPSIFGGDKVVDVFEAPLAKALVDFVDNNAGIPVSGTDLLRVLR